MHYVRMSKTYSKVYILTFKGSSCKQINVMFFCSLLLMLSCMLSTHPPPAPNSPCQQARITHSLWMCVKITKIESFVINFPKYFIIIGHKFLTFKHMYLEPLFYHFAKKKKKEEEVKKQYEGLIALNSPRFNQVMLNLYTW